MIKQSRPLESYEFINEKVFYEKLPLSNDIKAHTAYDTKFQQAVTA